MAKADTIEYLFYSAELSSVNAVIFSASHQASSLAEREAFALSAEEKAALVRNLLEIPEVFGVVPLETCNRVEYVVAISKNEAADLVEKTLRASNPKAPFSRLFGVDALRHLFRVAAGLDSMVLGEAQIAGQLKSAYYESHAAGWTDSSLNRLFHRAFFVSKRVRSSTKIGWGNVSVASLGVKLSRQIVGELGEAKVLVIGAGEMAELVSRHLLSQGARDLVIASRTPERAWSLAQRVGASAQPMEHLPSLVERADVIVSAVTTHGSYVLTRAIVESIVADRGKCILDLSFPRSIDPEIVELDGLYLYTIEDLRELSQQNLHGREASRGEAETVVDEEVARYLSEAVHEELGEFSQWVKNEVDREERRLRRSLVRQGVDAESLGVLTTELRQGLDALAARLVHGKRVEIRKRGRG